MIDRKSSVARILMLGCAGVFCLGASYTWTGGGANDDWDNGDNWSCTGLCGSYPVNGDDAAADGTFTIDLIDQAIDDLTLSGTITFGDAGGDDPVLCLDTLTITAGADLQMTEGARLITGAGCPH
jgi:hypothetical protein